MRNRLLAVAAIALLAAPLFARCGDCNADSNTNILDALQAAQDAASILVVADPVACDIDNSGTVNILDALKIAQYSAGLGVVLKCGDPVWLMHCGGIDNDSSLTVGPAVSPPALGVPNSTNFYSLESIPGNALSIEVRLIFNAPTDYDLLVGGVSTIPGDTNPANYPLQDRFSNPAIVLIDAMSVPSIMDITSAGQPLAIAVHCFNSPGNAYTLSVTCTQPVPPKIRNITLGASLLETTVVSAGSPVPDFLIPESTCWFVLGSFPPTMQHLDVVVTNLSGDHDLYIGAPATGAPDPYSAPAYPRKSATAMMVESYSLDAMTLATYTGGPLVIAVTAVTPGNFTIDVTGYSDLACGNNKNESLTAGTSPTRGLLTNANATRLYSLGNVPVTTTEIRIEMTGTSMAGDVDLYVGSTTPGDVVKTNYEFRQETAGTSDELVVIDAMSTPDIFSFLGSPIAVALSAYQAGDISLTITCMTGGPPAMVRNLTCGGTEMGMLTMPSGTSTPPLLAQPGTTDFYCLPIIPVGTAFVTFRVTGSAGSQYMVLIGAPTTVCGSTNPFEYPIQSVPTVNPEAEVSVCTQPDLALYMGTNVAVAVHWVSGPVPDYTIEVICDPIPMFCCPVLSCGASQQGGLPQSTAQFPTVVFSQNVDTHFFVLFPVPQGVGQITFNLGPAAGDPDADYDLFIGGPFTMPCAGVSTAYMWASQLSVPLQDVIVLNAVDLMQFGCNPIPIAVYYYDDGPPAGGYALSITCN